MKKSVRIAICLVLAGLLALGTPRGAYAQPEENTGVEETTPLSSNTHLYSLEFAQGELVPAFSPEQLQYTITVPHGIERVTLRAKTEDMKAKMNIHGTGDLAVGQNTVTICVTAENGMTRTYEILVIREEAIPPVGEEETSAQEQTQQPPETPEETPEEPATEEPASSLSEEEIPDSTEKTGDSSAAETGDSHEGQFVIDENGSDESFLDRYHTLIMAGGIGLAILLIIIIVVLLLSGRKGAEEEDGEEETDREEESVEEQEDAWESVKEERSETSAAENKPVENITAEEIQKEVALVDWDAFDEEEEEEPKKTNAAETAEEDQDEDDFEFLDM